MAWVACRHDVRFTSTSSRVAQLATSSLTVAQHDGDGLSPSTMALYKGNTKIITKDQYSSSRLASLVTAFALGMYMVLAPVDAKTGIAVCVLSPFTMLYRNKGRLQKLYALAGPLYIRMGLWALLSLTKDILSGVLKECWTLILIFGWAGYTTYCRHHR
ncbi:hypothetical protein OsJ_28915 [Oryza sativa Japonica Group]|uniref:Uncharacterized protein n=1 Tax=Oryza sativa subsp. japonica TaxID=39947 RepID=A3BXK3_ORYSJ|nr:hypothetical protein OsJ_28915 [Oryza sativa Japonica Group]